MRDFADPLIVYTPSLSLPLDARGRGFSLKRSCSIFVHCYLDGA